MRHPDWAASHWRRTIVLTASIGAISLAAACADRDGETAGDERDSDERPGQTTAVATAGAVPAAIEALGHHAENAYDMARISDWARTRASADSVRPAIDSLSAGSTTADARAARSTLQELDRAIADRSRQLALVAANRLTELGARLAAPHAPRVPAEVTLLDYYGRELEIWAAEGDLARLRLTGDSIRVTWQAVKPRIEQRGGTADAASFEALVQKVQRARTTSEFGALATPILDEVDRLESVFAR